MKNYYASLNGKCYAFQGKTARDEAVNKRGYKPLTAAEAMKQFGYTDSCSRRVIKCIVLPRCSMEKTKLNLPLPLPLYQGIAVDGDHAGEMIEGSALFSIIDGDEEIAIVPPEEEALAVPIRPETLCMYIGKEDMNGVNVFTGYVLKYEGELDGEKLDTEYIMPYWEQSVCSFLLHSSQSDLPVDIDKYISECEIIGNIHENPELLRLFPHLHGGKQ